MANTPEQNQQIIIQLSQQWAAANGVKDVQGFVTAMLGIAGAESGWRDDAIHDNGQGFGLYGLHNKGYAGALDKEKRLDAYMNTEAALAQLGPLYVQSEGQGWQVSVSRMTGPLGQNPKDPQQLFQNSVAAATSLGAPTTTTTTPAGTAAGVGAGGIAAKAKAWAGLSDEEWAADPAGWTQVYLEQAGGGTSDPYEMGMLGVSQGTLAETQKQNALEAYYKSIENLVNAGVWDADYAADEYTRTINKVNAETSRLGEARVRGEDVQKSLEERAALTTESEYAPGYGPNDPLAQAFAARGMNPQLVKGTPASQFPDPWETFRQANLSVGMPGTMEPLQFPTVSRPTNPNTAIQPRLEATVQSLYPQTAQGGGYQGPTPETAAESSLSPEEQQHLANIARDVMQRITGRF